MEVGMSTVEGPGRGDEVSDRGQKRQRVGQGIEMCIHLLLIPNWQLKSLTCMCFLPFP